MKWRSQNARLKFDFIAEMRSADDKDQWIAALQIREQVVYKIKEGKFVLAIGKNPVPQC